MQSEALIIVGKKADWSKKSQGHREWKYIATIHWKDEKGHKSLEPDNYSGVTPMKLATTLAENLQSYTSFRIMRANHYDEITVVQVADNKAGPIYSSVSDDEYKQMIWMIRQNIIR